MEKSGENEIVKDQETPLFKANRYFKRFLRDFIDLEEGVDKLATINEIKNKKSMSGANAWMLMCSIVIASVGLDLDSPAVIIGAMLISPLMSPILGMGLAIGINDKDTLKKSLSHFSMAVLIAIIVSTLYFMISPIVDMTDQIKARTGPGPLDIMVAFFGGIAGIISIARKDILTTIPGVAIATALMPPLCVTGFGIATGNWSVALSSFFLFFINTVFVSFATYIVVRIILRFPHRDFVDDAEKRKNTLYIGVFLLAISIISYFPFKKIINERNDNRRLEEFMNLTIGENRKYVDDYGLSRVDGEKILVMKVYGDSINNDKMELYQLGLKTVGLENTKIEIISTSEITMDNILSLDKKINGMEEMASKLNVVQKEKKETDAAINQLKKELQSFRMDSTNFIQISNELKALNENIVNITYAKAQTDNFKEYQSDQLLFIIDWNEKLKTNKEDELMMARFLKQRLNADSLRLIHEYQIK